MRKHIQTPTGCLAVLTKGDDVLEALERIAVQENVQSASFFGLGFASRAKFGFFDHAQRSYHPKEFCEIEITNLTGTIAWEEGTVSIHAHATGCDDTFAAVGGHLLEMIVGKGSIEITLVDHKILLKREFDANVGGKVLQLQ